MSNIMSSFITIERERGGGGGKIKWGVLGAKGSAGELNVTKILRAF